MRVVLSPMAMVQMVSNQMTAKDAIELVKTNQHAGFLVNRSDVDALEENVQRCHRLGCIKAVFNMMGGSGHLREAKNLVDNHAHFVVPRPSHKFRVKITMRNGGGSAANEIVQEVVFEARGVAEAVAKADYWAHKNHPEYSWVHFNTFRTGYTDDKMAKAHGAIESY